MALSIKRQEKSPLPEHGLSCLVLENRTNPTPQVLALVAKDSLWPSPLPFLQCSLGHQPQGKLENEQEG